MSAGTDMSNENSRAITNPDQPAGNPEWGYWLNFTPGPDAVLHDFCGKNDIAGAHCPNCDLPLLRLLSLHANDPVLNLDPDRFSVVHLLYCWTCSIPFGEFCYKVDQDGSVRLLRLPPRSEYEHGPDGPVDGYTGQLPHRQVSLEFISGEDQLALKQRWESTRDDIDILRGLDEPRHQVGGYPFIYNPIRIVCPECSQDMPLFAAICNGATGNDAWKTTAEDSFVGNGGVQMVFHLCRNCSILSAYSSCD
jgi:hypothetical protein